MLRTPFIIEYVFVPPDEVRVIQIPTPTNRSFVRKIGLILIGVSSLLLLIDWLLGGRLPPVCFAVSNPVLWLSSLVGVVELPFVVSLAAIIEWPISVAGLIAPIAVSAIMMGAWCVLILGISRVIPPDSSAIRWVTVVILSVGAGLTIQRCLHYRLMVAEAADRDDVSARYSAKLAFYESAMFSGRGLRAMEEELKQEPQHE